MPEYRIEISPNNRAGCTDSVCKKEAAKCKKGSIRFGTWATIMDHGGWKWKHWGCVSGEQIAHVRELTESNGKFDYEALDGYDEMSEHPDLQAKIRNAIDQGHIAAEDFNGDPWMNQLGKRGIRGKKPKDWDDGEDAGAKDDASTNGKKRGRKAADEDDEEKPKPKRGKKAAVKAEAEVEEEKPQPKRRAARKSAVKEESTEDEEEAPKPKRGAKKAAGKKAKVEESEEEAEIEPTPESEDDEEEEEEPTPKKAAPKGRKKAAPAASADKPKRAGRPRARK